jgi:Flp pilus assembly protein TadD
MSRKPRLALAALLLVALGGHTVRALHRVQSSQITGAVRLRLGGAAQRQERLPATVLRGALAALARARELDPVAVEPRAFAGDVLLFAGQEAAAVEAYRAAAAHDLRPEILLHWGEALWRQGRREEAIVQWRRGQALAPIMSLRLPVPAHRLAAEPLRPMEDRAGLTPRGR